MIHESAPQPRSTALRWEGRDGRFHLTPCDAVVPRPVRHQGRVFPETKPVEFPCPCCLEALEQPAGVQNFFLCRRCKYMGSSRSVRNLQAAIDAWSRISDWIETRLSEGDHPAESLP